MLGTHISFYLRTNRIHVFVDTLRGIGSPSRICFMIEQSGEKLLIAPYNKRDFKSHNVPADVYNGAGGLEINSMKLCNSIADLHQWEPNSSYRVHGRILTGRNLAIFNLKEAELIK